MIHSSSPKTKLRRELTAQAFEQLLSALHADRTKAAETYEHIRQALITFFTYRGAADPLELADETFNRVAGRLQEGAEIFAQNPLSYFYGFARNIWRERLAHPVTTEALEDARLSPHTADPHELLVQAEERCAFERRLHCLEICLQKLAAPDRELLIAYYQGTGSAKIENRQDLANRFRITLKTLRNKTSKLRSGLVECVRRCLGARDK
jgi:DNA-directed RNA polymerase specialized sigma24 family protein